jgi:Mg-chelatase subunit ChlD
MSRQSSPRHSFCGRAAALALAIFACGIPSLHADQRVDPMDIIVALDKSLSMVEEIAAVKEYVASSIVDGLVIPGDLLIVVAFYGKTDVPVSTVVTDAASKDAIKKAIGAIRADGRWTDIGNALDELRRQLEAHGRQGIPKHLLLITDGKPEPPPDSKYWSPDGSFTHEFLDNTETIQREGWKVQVLGLGSGADARELADKLSGIYTQVPENPTAQQLAETTREFLGSLRISGDARLSPIGRGGAGKLRLTVESTGYESTKNVTLSGIKLTIGDDARENLLGRPFVFEVPPSGSTQVSIPVVVQPRLAPGRYTGTFLFSYATEEQVTPTVLTVDIRVNSVLQNNLAFVIPGAILIVAGLVLLTLLLARRSAVGEISFLLVVAEQPLQKGEDHFTMKRGSERFLEEREGVVGLTEARTDRSIARLAVTGEDPAALLLSLEVLEPKGFVHPKEVPTSPLGAELLMRTDKGHKLHVRFEAAGKDA